MAKQRKISVRSRDNSKPWPHDYVVIGPGQSSSGGGQQSSFTRESCTPLGQQVWDVIKLFVVNMGNFKGYSSTGMYFKWDVTDETTTEKVTSIMAVCDKLKEEGHDVEFVEITKVLRREVEIEGPSRLYSQESVAWWGRNYPETRRSKRAYRVMTYQDMETKWAILKFKCKVKPTEENVLPPRIRLPHPKS